MSPHFRFLLQEVRCHRARELLRSGGMEFAEERRDWFRVFDHQPEVRDIPEVLEEIKRALTDEG